MKKATLVILILALLVLCAACTRQLPTGGSATQTHTVQTANAPATEDKAQAKNASATETKSIEKTQTKSASTAETSSVKPSVLTTKSISRKDDPYLDIIIEDYGELKELRDIDGNYIHYHTFYDLDGDGTKELLLGVDDGFGVCLTSVYVIQNGIAVWVEGFINDLEYCTTPPSLFKNGTIMMGEFGYYRLKDGKFMNKSLTEKDGKYYHFTINGPYPGVSITKEEFDRVRKEYEGDGEIVKLDWKPLAEYGK